MAILKEVYEISLDLLDKRDGSGRLDDNRLLSIKNKVPSIATAIQLELAEMNNLRLENPLLKSMEDYVDLPDFSAYTVMPYGIAAELARQGGDSEAASYHLSKYEQMKKKIRLPAGEIEDSENFLNGLWGRC